MISKNLTAHSFYHTCRYIIEKPGAEVLIAQDVRGHDYRLMAEDFELQRQLHPEKKQSCFHSILSFYPGENPDNEKMLDIAKKYLEELGIVNTQYTISKHTDRHHLHMHIIANMVNNDGKVIRDNWIGYRGKKIAQRLTQEYKLVPAISKNLSQTNLEALNQVEANKYKIYIAINQALPQCQSMKQLEDRLLKRGIETQYKYKRQTNEKQGISFKLNGTSFKGSQVDRKFSYSGLDKILQQQQMQSHKKDIRLNLYESNDTKQVRNSVNPEKNKVPGDSHLPDASKIIVEKIGDVLLKQEYIDQMPQELSQKEYMRTKKKRQRLG